MTITVAVKVDHLPTASVPATAHSFLHSLVQPKTVLVPNLEQHGTVSSIKAFIRANLRLAEEQQQLMAPLYTRLNEKDLIEEVYGRYTCHADLELPDLHVDEDSLTFFGKEGSRTVELVDGVRLDEYHILDKAALVLKCLPKTLPELGGRIFVETKDGVIPLLGISPWTHIAELKQALENMTGIPVAQQLLSSVGRVMHDEFIVKDFDGFHAVYEDSVIDLCKSGDSSIDQGHRRMVIFVNVVGEQDFTLVVQGRDTVQSVCQAVESRTGISAWQQRLSFSGKVLQDKKTLGEYFVHPECTLQVTTLRTPHKQLLRSGACTSTGENAVFPEEIPVPKPAARKVKLVRTSKGHVKGTLTIPVLTTDTIHDLKRKIRCSLQPLLERSASLSTSAKDQFHIHVTPKSSPHPAPHGEPQSENAKGVARSLFSPSPASKRNQIRPPASPVPSKMTSTPCPLSENLSPNQRSSPVGSPTNRRQVSDGPPASPAKVHSLRKLQLKFNGMGSQNQSPKSTGLQWHSPNAGNQLQRQMSKSSTATAPPSPRSVSQSQRHSSRSSAAQSECHSPRSPATQGPRNGLPRSHVGAQPQTHASLLAQSSSRDLMPELLSLPLPTNNRFSSGPSVQPYSDDGCNSLIAGEKAAGKFGAWFNEGIQAMKTFKEHVKAPFLDR